LSRPAQRPPRSDARQGSVQPQAGESRSRPQAREGRLRIVCLVPSLTETIAHFGRLDELVGRTRYCVEPAGSIEGIEAVGGTKNPDCRRIIELAPDLVVVNKEENRVEDFETLQEAGLCVHVTHPRTVGEALDMLTELGRAVGADEAADLLVAECRRALDEAARLARDAAQVTAFCPIWRNPWMTFSAETYVGDVLRSAGFANVFADEAGDFFEVTIEEVVNRSPHMVLLPDEPYVFGSEHCSELHDAGVAAPCVCLDGKDLSWYGPRIAGALVRLSKLRASAMRT
jgi:ABC-type Fe3+-hydroxamate transport system substrate-binding protein